MNLLLVNLVFNLERLQINTIMMIGRTVEPLLHTPAIGQFTYWGQWTEQDCLFLLCVQVLYLDWIYLVNAFVFANTINTNLQYVHF